MLVAHLGSRTTRSPALAVAAAAAPLRRLSASIPEDSSASDTYWRPGNVQWREGNHPPARMLTGVLMKAPSIEQLLDLSERHGEAFNAVHVGALWVRLGRLAHKSAAGRRWLQQQPPSLMVTLEHTLRLLPAFAPRHIANVAAGAARCGLGTAPPWTLFWSQIASQSVPNLRGFSNFELKELAWGFATAGAAQPRLFDALGAEALERVEGLSATEVAMLAWSFAASGQGHSPLLPELAFVVPPPAHHPAL